MLYAIYFIVKIFLLGKKEFANNVKYNSRVDFEYFTITIIVVFYYHYSSKVIAYVFYKVFDII